MTHPTLSDRLRLARLQFGGAGVGLRARTSRLTSPLRRGLRAVAEEFRFVPPDLRPGDPGILDELNGGQLGLSGQVYEIGSASPFELQGAHTQWLRELHGFTWLGGLRAAGTGEASAVARRLVFDWCRRVRQRGGLAAEADDMYVRARRLIAWQANAGLLLEDAPAEFHRAFARTLGGELRSLSRNMIGARPGPERLTCWMGLALACLSIAGHDRQLPAIEAAMMAELRRQILPDGGHISRNNDMVLELLLDLLPVRQCYLARGLTVPMEITDAIGRMMLALKAGSTTSRELARFNGVSVSRSDTLALVLSLDETGNRPQSGLTASRYARLQQASTTVIVDCGAPPSLQYACQAHAGCLSFELGANDEAVFVNRGAPGPGHEMFRPDARATVSHSTLVVGDQSSARLVRSRHLEARFTSPPIRGPERVESGIVQNATSLELTASHDGYLKRFGVIHERSLTLSDGGQVVVGVDRIRGARASLRLAHDLPLAVHFHVPLEASLQSNAAGVTISTRGGARWLLSASNCQMAIEAATDYGQVRGPTPAKQIVLRTTCPGEIEIPWRIARMGT